jgi:hypothetical protein
MQQTFGDFVKERDGQEYLEVHFSPTSVPLQQRWRNNSLSANFLAEYWTTFFPAQDLPSQRRQQEIKGAIGYIANELLENIMKFSYKPANYPVTLGLYLYQDAFRFYTRNAIDPQEVAGFQARIQKLLSEDTQALYMQQMEQNALEAGKTSSQLGLLTLINDYGARLAWLFETLADDSEPELTIVTTMVELAI